MSALFFRASCCTPSFHCRMAPMVHAGTQHVSAVRLLFDCFSVLCCPLPFSAAAPFVVKVSTFGIRVFRALVGVLRSSPVDVCKRWFQSLKSMVSKSRTKLITKSRTMRADIRLNGVPRNIVEASSLYLPLMPGVRSDFKPYFTSNVRIAWRSS